MPLVVGVFFFLEIFSSGKVLRLRGKQYNYIDKETALAYTKCYGILFSDSF